MTGLSYRFGMGLVLLGVLFGCGGGGGNGSSGSDTSQDDPAARDRAFADEAVQRVLDRANVSCEDVFCTGDAIMSIVEDVTLGTFIAACEYVCLPVAIDLDEPRHYDVRLLWRRVRTACFDAAEFEVLILGQVPVPCIPTQ